GENIRVWSTASGAEILNLEPPGRQSYGVQGVAYSPNGKLLAASRGQSTHIWKARTGASHLEIPKTHKDTDISLAFLNDECLRSGQGGQFRFWDMKTGELLRELKTDGRLGTSMALST